ncbi:hypothetical protein NEFER03_2117 [Nematocida sp. LUAm3]|nr:hypothetical protein NEFER03_2117 [Nematocida sp. LUAm3]KAI5175631.1 hypothetical protein NEFER02_1518 [Nematocida sp. LUAm2]KAI5178537.1 hypothetical protein NEFER01_1673 [Nematocida sp. LUAm1]
MHLSEGSKEIMQLFDFLDAEKKGYLTQKQAHAFWYHMKYLGWPKDTCIVTKENVISLAAECKKNHKRIISLLSSSPSETLHKISSSLTEEELEEINKHLN